MTHERDLSEASRRAWEEISGRRYLVGDFQSEGSNNKGCEKSVGSISPRNKKTGHRNEESEGEHEKK